MVSILLGTKNPNIYFFRPWPSGMPFEKTISLFNHKQLLTGREVSCTNMEDTPLSNQYTKWYYHLFLCCSRESITFRTTFLKPAIILDQLLHLVAGFWKNGGWKPGSDGDEGLTFRHHRCKQPPGWSISEHDRTRLSVEFAEGFANYRLTHVSHQSKPLRKRHHLVGYEDG